MIYLVEVTGKPIKSPGGVGSPLIVSGAHAFCDSSLVPRLSTLLRSYLQPAGRVNGEYLEVVAFFRIVVALLRSYWQPSPYFLARVPSSS